MTILSNKFPINWESAQNDYYITLNKAEILYLINNNELFIEQMNEKIKDFLHREEHMTQATIVG